MRFELDPGVVEGLVGVLREHIPEVSLEAVQEIERQVPEYRRSNDSRYREVLYSLVEGANYRFLDLTERMHALAE
ncbi:hypothetical protein ACRYCC_34680 [Actinomadura scrupuli]|uniref:hypothetical protein n=1 Tax=Actinomadura scrupuli TaxID=559629 RepID=UPI003D9822B4